MRVNKWLDFADRVGWTAIQASGASGVAALASGLDWKQALIVVGTATLAAVLKVAAAQQIGDSELGDAVPGHSVIEETD